MLPGGIDCDSHQLPSDSSSAKFWQEAYAERATMRIHGPAAIANHVAPTNDIVTAQCDELRVLLSDVIENKLPRLVEWRRLQKREKLFLAGDSINYVAEAGNMFLGNRGNDKLVGHCEWSEAISTISLTPRLFYARSSRSRYGHPGPPRSERGRGRR